MARIAGPSALAPAGTGAVRCTYALGETSWGWVAAGGTDDGLSFLTLPQPDRKAVLREVLDRLGPVPEDRSAHGYAFDALERYFAGEHVALYFPIAPEGTPFQLAVWEAVRRIPYGETRSYGDIARAVGCPRGAHAVGQAVAVAPVGIVIPCHRVISADGTIGGYGERIDLKRRLLLLEGVVVKDVQASRR